MFRNSARLIAAALFAFTLFGGSAHSQYSREQVVELIIQLSIAQYSGSCPCPHSQDRAGRRCGNRSAYSQPGGAHPVCYPSQVSDRMIEQFLQTQ